MGWMQSGDPCPRTAHQINLNNRKHATMAVCTDSQQDNYRREAPGCSSFDEEVAFFILGPITNVLFTKKGNRAHKKESCNSFNYVN